MYTEKEFLRLAAVLPDDFASKTTEFWSYVEDKLRMYLAKIQRVYRDEIFQHGDPALHYLSSIDQENYSLVKRLVEHGAAVEATEDSMLIAESQAWLEMTMRQPSGTIAQEFYHVTMRERDEYVSKKIEETLKEDELGILFLEPTRSIKLNEQIKVIKMCRFDPADYVRSWQVQLASRK